MSRASMPKSIAPSPTLLRFLRAQNDGYVFFTPNHALKKRSVPASVLSKAPANGKLTPSLARSITTYSPAAVAPLVGSTFVRLLDSLGFNNPQQPGSQSPPDGSTHKNVQPPSYTSRYSISPSDNAPPNLRRTAIHTRKLSTSSTQASTYHEGHGLNHLTRWARFWGSRQRIRPTESLQPNDLPPLSSFLDDGASLGGRITRPANEMRLRCTEFDENGNVTLVNGEFKKSELIARYGLLPRDLRKIDSALLPSIVIRQHAILINLLHLRVLIKHNRVLVFDAYGSTDSYTQSQFMYDLEGKLRSAESRTATPSVGALPYEFRALEAVLISVTTGLESEFEYVREPVVRVLRELEEDIDRDKLRHLLIYSKKLGTFEQKARLVRDAIDDLLEADDDLAAMYLTEKMRAGGGGKAGRAEDDHTEVEMLLESYHKVCDEIVQVSGNLVSNIRNTEEIVKAILDANRNSLMLLDLKFSIGTLGIAGGTFVAALYGMNLKNFIEESDLGFWGVSAWCTVFSIVVCWYGLKKLRRVQRVSMWGSSGREDASSGGIFAPFTGAGGSAGGSGRKGIRGRSGWAQLGGLERGGPNAGQQALFDNARRDRHRSGAQAQAQAQAQNHAKAEAQDAAAFAPASRPLQQPHQKTASKVKKS